MSMTINSPAAAGPWQRICRTAQRLHESWVRQRTIAALSSLDDHALRDIGVHRSQIRQVANDLAQGIQPRLPVA